MNQNLRFGCYIKQARDVIEASLNNGIIKNMDKKGKI